MPFVKCSSKYELGAIVLTGIYVLSSVGLIAYSALKRDPYPRNTLLPEISKIRKCLDELGCDDVAYCSGDIVRHCSGIQSPQQHSQHIPISWLTDDSCKSSIRQMTDEILRGENVKVSRGLSMHKFRISKVKGVIQSGPSYALHWYLMDMGDGGENDWTSVEYYGRTKATYTVSRGPENAWNGSAIAITEDGLYHIYAKITFNCTNDDNEMKRVAFRVTVKDPSTTGQKEILVASETAQCSMIGDLVTLYQSGYFPMQYGSKIYLEYLRSTGVEISRRHRAYKSFFGVYKASQLSHKGLS